MEKDVTEAPRAVHGTTKVYICDMVGCGKRLSGKQERFCSGKCKDGFVQLQKRGE